VLWIAFGSFVKLIGRRTLLAQRSLYYQEKDKYIDCTGAIIRDFLLSGPALVS
jgi:hypothetical protein